MAVCQTEWPLTKKTYSHTDKIKKFWHFQFLEETREIKIVSRKRQDSIYIKKLDTTIGGLLTRIIVYKQHLYKQFWDQTIFEKN